jgi:hypothetical protein
MPRTGKGGSRQGTPGKLYPNRTDLSARKPLAPVAPSGQPYGVRGAQISTQRILPAGAPGTTVPSPPAPNDPAPSGSGGPGGGGLAALLGALNPTAGIGPGSLPPLDRPTERPNEPLTHGSPSGPGAGPEVLGLPTPSQNLGQLLNSLAAGPRTNPDIAFLANYTAGGRQ